MNNIEQQIGRLETYAAALVADQRQSTAHIARMVRDSATTMQALYEVAKAAEKLRDDLLMRAEIGTYDGDKTVQAGATVWWLLNDRLDNLRELTSESD